MFEVRCLFHVLCRHTIQDDKQGLAAFFQHALRLFQKVHILHLTKLRIYETCPSIMQYPDIVVKKQNSKNINRYQTLYIMRKRETYGDVDSTLADS